MQVDCVCQKRPALARPTNHSLSLRRYHRDGFLRVDGGERVTGQSRGSLRTLNTGELTYLGGVETEVGITVIND